MKNEFIHKKINGNFLVVGTANNCEKLLKKSISNIKLSIGKVKKVHFLIIESDSQDNTVNLLDELTKDFENFRFISLGTQLENYPIKSDRIAYARNVYVREINENKIYKDINYIVVADLDEINHYLNDKSFNSCWDRDDWDMCSANQVGPYYDMYALRHPKWMPYDYKIKHEKLKRQYPNYKNHLNDILYSKIKTISKDHKWISVDSSFGGLAIYKKDCFNLNKYIGINENGDEICEHVEFNLNLKKKGKNLFINPKLINSIFTEHTKPPSFWKILRRKLNFIKLIKKKIL